MAKAGNTSWVTTAIWLIWPLPTGWIVWFLIYFTSVDPNDGRGFPDEMFWWDEALFVSLFLGTISATPLIGLIAVIQFMRHAKKRIDARR